MKTARFREIVKKCGRPDVYLSWVPPKQDRALMSALKQNRVMTVHQTVRGSAKDYGTVGIIHEGTAQILIFPRSLKRFTDRRVIGIDYGLLASAGRRADQSRPEAGGSAAGSARSKPETRRHKKANTDDGPNESAESEAGDGRPFPPVEPKSSRQKRPARALSWRDLGPRIAEIKKEISKRAYTSAARRLRELADLVEEPAVRD